MIVDNQYFGRTAQAVFKVVDGKQKLVHAKHVRCIVPSFEATTLTVTYGASQARTLRS